MFLLKLFVYLYIKKRQIMKTLEKNIEWVRTGNKIGIANEVVGVEKLRFIDIDNINKYKKNDVYSILIQFGIWTNVNYSKKVLIGMLMRNQSVLEKIKINNQLYNRQNNLQALIG